MYLGLDIGGANLKYVVLDESGAKGGVVYFPLWKRENLKKLPEKLKVCEVKAVCAVTTAELCDTFASREEGVKFVEKTVKAAFPKAFLVSVEGKIRDKAEPPLDFAASNWVASVRYLLEEGWREFLFVDMGTTTTDVIPVREGTIRSAKNDFERLRRGELVYVGMLRTPTFHVLRRFKVPLAPEFYSVVGDALVVTGDMDKDDYICETPDGRGVSREECMQRLSRQLCSDLKELGEDFVVEMAFCVREELVRMVAEAMEWQAQKWQLERVVGCGKGEFLLREAAERVGLKFKGLSEEVGELSEIFPAYACAVFAKEMFEAE